MASRGVACWGLTSPLESPFENVRCSIAVLSWLQSRVCPRHHVTCSLYPDSPEVTAAHAQRRPGRAFTRCHVPPRTRPSPPLRRSLPWFNIDTTSALSLCNLVANKLGYPNSYAAAGLSPFLIFGLTSTYWETVVLTTTGCAPGGERACALRVNGTRVPWQGCKL